MNSYFSKNLIIIAFILFLILGVFAMAEAVFNEQINYQGILTGTDDVAVDGSYNLKFGLCITSNCTDGSDPIWTETRCFSPDDGSTCDGTGTDQRVSITDGLFSVLLGSITSLSSVNFNQTLWLEVQVGGSGTTPSWETLTPRKQLGAVPAAFETKQLAGSTWESPGTLGSTTPNTGAFTTLSAAVSDLSTALTVTQSSTGNIADFIGDSITSGTGLSISANGLVTGTALDISSTSTAGGESGSSKLLNFSRSGDNANASHTAYGLYVAVTNTGTTSTNIAGYFSASGATNNYGLIVESGNVGIGDTNPDYPLEILSTTTPQLAISYNDASDYTTFEVAADGALTITTRDDTGVEGDIILMPDGNVGIRTATPGYNLSVGSTDDSDQVGIYHDNDHAFFKTTDGYFIFQTDEGTDMNTHVEIYSKDSGGTGFSLFSIYDQDHAEYLRQYAYSGEGVINVGGTSPVALHLQQPADIPILLFQGATDNETQELKIYGYASGDQRRSLEIGVGVDAADTASFDGVGNYYFDGNVGIGTTSPSSTLHVIGDIIAASSTLSGNLDVIGTGTFGSLSIGSLTGFLKATSGIVSTSTVAYGDLTGSPSDVITAGTLISWSVDTLNVDNNLHNYSWTNVVDTDIPDAITVTGYMQDEDINAFSELQTWVTDATLLKAGTLTDGKICIWDNTGTEIDCDYTDSDTQLSEEAVEDFAWSVLGGTQTLIAVTYQDETNVVDFVINNDLSQYSNATSGFLTTVAYGDLTGNPSDVITAGTNLTWSDSTLNATDTTYTASGTLLNLTDTAFNVNAGTLTNDKGCKFTTASGLVCDQDYLTSAITSLGGLTGAAQTFVNDTNITMTSAGTTHTLGWTGTLADGRIASASTWNAKENALTFSTGLTRTDDDITVNTSQNITALSNLTSNGFVKTSGGTGTLSVDTNTYLTGNQSITLSGDVTGSGATAITTTIGANKILESMLKEVDGTPADEDILTYEIIGDFQWHSSSELGIGTATSITDNLIVPDDFAHSQDYGDWSIDASGVAQIDSGVIGATEIADDSITNTEFTHSTDWGDIVTDASGNVNIDSGVIVVGDLSSTDFGDWTCNGTSCSIDSQNSAFWIDRVSDETGTGAWVFATSPALATPSITTSLTVTDDDWIGLGASKGRIVFDDDTTDYVYFSDTNVGIATSTPATLLHLSPSSGTSELRIETADTNDPTLSFKTASTTHQINMYLDENMVTDELVIAGQTAGAHTSLQLAAKDGQSAAFYLSSGGTYYSYIVHVSDDNLQLTNATQDKDIIFTVNKGGADTEIMRIDGSAGNVGIGDDSPASLLTVGSGDLFQVNSSGEVVAGTWAGNAIGDDYIPNNITIDLAASSTALAANPANCSAGNAPLGIDASGAVESCFDVWTEAENTAAGYISDITGENFADLLDIPVHPGVATKILETTAGGYAWIDTPGGVAWGDITGTLSNQTDLQTALDGKEPTITAGTTSQYWRGDKSWQTLDTSVVPENTNLYYTTARFDTAFSGKSTTNLSEGTNLYYTNARARAAISETVTGLTYTSGTGVLSLTANYVIPTTTQETNWDTAFGWGDHSGAGYITATLTEEEVQDYAGAMAGSHLTYTDGSDDLSVDDDWWDALTDMVLTDNYIYVGDASNDPVGVAMSNDCTMASNGAITCDHDALDNFVANEHIDWTGASAGTIHTDNYIENATHTGDVTGATALTIGNDKVLEAHLKAVDAATDEDILTYESTTGDFEWHTKAELGIGTATAITDDLIVPDDFAHSQDYGDFSIGAGGSFTLDTDVIAVAEFLASQDWGDMSTDASGNVYLDADVVGTAEIAHVDFGDWTYATGSGVVENVQCSSCVDISVETNLAAGTNITLSGDTLNVDDAFVINSGSEIIGGGSGFTWTFDASVGTDPVLTFGDGIINVSAGALQVGGSAVLTTVAYGDLTGSPSDVITAGTGLSWATDTLDWSASGIAGHDTFTDFVAGEHFLQSAITEVGTIATGVWEGTAIADIYVSDTLTVTGYMQDEDINAFSELQTWVTDATLLKAGTLTDGKICTWDNTGTEIGCDYTDSDTQLSEEEVEDFAWSVLGGTQTLINVTYQDVTNVVDFVVNNDLSLYSNATSGFLTTVAYGNLTGSPSDVITAGTGLAWDVDTLNWSSTGLDWAGNTIGDAYIPNNITIDLAALATTLTITDNEDTNETNAVIFTSGGDLDGGNLGLESDGDFHYNPSTGMVTATGFTGAQLGVAIAPASDRLINLQMSSTDLMGVYVDGETNPYAGSGYSNMFRGRRTWDWGTDDFAQNIAGNLFYVTHQSSDAKLTADKGIMVEDLLLTLDGKVTNNTTDNLSLFAFSANLKTDNNATYDSSSSGTIRLHNRNFYSVIDEDSTFSNTGGAGTNRINNEAFYALVNSNPTLLSGNFLVQNMGLHVSLEGTTVGWSYNYGVFIEKVTGADENWGIYDDSGANWALDADNQKIIWGEGQNYSIEWDGNDAVHTITAGDFVFTGGNVGIGTATPTANLQVAQGTAGVGTISVGAGGTAVTGVGTQFLNTFKVGDTITSEGQTKTIATITTNTALTTDAWGAAISAKAYTLAGGTRFSVLGSGNVGIGTATPATSALLDISSTTGALLIPRMTTTQRDALTAVNGMVIYNSTTTAFNFYENGAWVVKGPGSFQIPAHEVIDPISGEEIEVGDFVLGTIDDTLDDGGLHGLWTKWDNVKEQLLEEIFGALDEDGSIDNEDNEEPEVTISGFFIQKVKQALASLGLFMENGIAYIEEITTKKITIDFAKIKKAEIDELQVNKIQMVDQKTGDVYCTWIEYGEMKKVRGECSTIEFSDSSGDSDNNDVTDGTDDQTGYGEGQTGYGDQA